MKPKVVAFRADQCGVSWYRMRMPLSEIMKNDAAEIRTSGSMLAMPLYRTEDTPEQIKAEMERQAWYTMLCNGADMLHTQRFPDLPMLGLMRGLSLLHGLPWILEIDDDVVNIDPFNPAYETYKYRTVEDCYEFRPIDKDSDANPDEMPMWQDGKLVGVKMKQQDRNEINMQQILQADAIFTTTQTLANLYGNMRRQSHPQDHIYLLPNSLTPEVWDAVERPSSHEGEVWVGWAGSTSHARDIDLIADIAEHLMVKHRNVRFFWQKLPQPRLMALAREYPERCVMYDGWAAVEEWHEYYVAMNFDIALGPLVDTAFNRGKSNLKWLEAGVCSQPFVCSRVGPYEESIRNRKDGFLCRRTNEWTRALDQLIGSKALREQVGGAARERVMTDFNMEKNYQLWVDAYRDVAEKLGPMARKRTAEIRDAIPATA